MTIKSYDGAALIQKRLDQVYGRYPSGSLSSREVIMTLPTSGDDNELAFKINSTITAAIYRKAEEFAKSIPPPVKDSFKLTALTDITVKVDNSAQRNAELSAEVMKSIS